MLAPHTGHVSNFRGLKHRTFEPVQLICSQERPDSTSATVQTGRPSWMHLEPDGGEVERDKTSRGPVCPAAKSLDMLSPEA